MKIQSLVKNCRRWWKNPATTVFYRCSINCVRNADILWFLQCWETLRTMFYQTKVWTLNVLKKALVNSEMKTKPFCVWEKSGLPALVASSPETCGMGQVEHLGARCRWEGSYHHYIDTVSQIFGAGSRLLLWVTHWRNKPIFHIYLIPHINNITNQFKAKLINK